MRTLSVFSLLCFFALTTPVLAGGVEQTMALQHDVDHVWTVTAAALVFLMQAGFLLLEAGSVRSKNSVNVAQKNLMDFILATVVFGAFGYMLMFGNSFGGWFGWEPDLLFFGYTEEWKVTFFIFQLMFCGTAATIMSGAVAERMSINGYLIGAMLIALLIYPVAGHWAWGGLLSGSDKPLLASMGFMDFAGSTVVHSVGAWVALAAIIVIGPRIGKFDEDGNPRSLHGHSPILATVGAIILWVGWIGFNGGSLLSGTGAFASVIANTIIAGGAGGTMLLFLGRLSSGVFRPDATINGVLGGLVAITAGADVVSTQFAFLIGAGGGAVVFASTYFLEHVLKLDDPLGAIPVHGFAGVFGTLSVAIFAPEDALLAGSRFEQLTAQLTGVAIVFVWAFGVSFAVLKAIDVALGTTPEGGRGLRVPEIHELEGLNTHEHDAPMGTGILQQVMAELVNKKNGLPKPLQLDYGDEAYETSVLFNQIIQDVAAERDAEQKKYSENRSMRMAVEAEISEVVVACANGDFSRRLETAGRQDFLLELCNGINALCAATENAMNAIEGSLHSVAAGDLSHKMEGTHNGQLGSIQTAMNKTLEQISDVVEDVRLSVNASSRGDFSKVIDLDGKQGFVYDLCSAVNLLCDTSEKGLSELLGVLSRVGDGDLTAEMSNDYEGRFAEIGSEVEKMTKGIAELLNSIEETALKVSAGSQQISDLSAAVASGSESQSKSLDTMTQLLSDLKDTATQNADGAQIADQNCLKALASADAGVETAAELNQQIMEIQDATENIMDALKQIETITTQTNLLSLNASVEAVRAGGSDGSTAGFKVVAQEIRSLADHSAIAAGDIRSKVALVQDAVQRGAELVSKTDTVLNDINQAISESSVGVNGLAENGVNQVEMAAQISEQVAAISRESQDNLRMANQSADASKQLDEDAEQNTLKIARFKTAGEYTDRAA